jgi:hypothetical protein
MRDPRFRQFVSEPFTGTFRAVVRDEFSEAYQNGYKRLVEVWDHHGQPASADTPMWMEGIDKSGVNPISFYSQGWGNWPNDYTEVTGWYPDQLQGWDFYAAHAYVEGFRNGPIAATDVLARTNPSRPKANLGMLIQDFVELPRMIFSLGNNLKNGPTNSAQNAASGYLSYRFGWAPLYEDLKLFLEVAEYVSKRNKELHKLFEGGGTRHRVELDKATGTDETTQFLHSGWPIGFRMARRHVHSKHRSWGTVCWTPTTAPGYKPSESEYLDLAKKTVHGATASGLFASAWDVIPWTWLLGWIVNVRAFVLAHGNTIPAQSSPVCIMHEIDTTQTFVPLSYEGPTDVVKTWRKQRNVYPGATFGAFLPHLDAGRLSVLGALTVQRFR